MFFWQNLSSFVINTALIQLNTNTQENGWVLHFIKAPAPKHLRMEVRPTIYKLNWWKSPVMFTTRGEKIAPWPSWETSLTLQAVSVQKLLAFLVHFDPTLCTAHTLPSDAPQQTLALVAVSGRGGGPHLKIVWCGAGDGVDESLQSFLVYMVFLLEQKKWGGCNNSKVFRRVF